MSLIDELRGSQYSGLTDQQCLDHLNATVTISTDSTPYTWSGLGVKLLSMGISSSIVINARTLIQGISPGGAMLDGCLSSGGFDCSSAENRGLIAGAGVDTPPDAVTLLNAILQIGVTTGSRWTLVTSTQPTLSDVSTARAAITSANQVSAFLNNHWNAAIASGATKSTLQSLAANDANWS
jgi:hypothetical protein